jgi:hypothetical protein
MSLLLFFSGSPAPPPPDPVIGNPIGLLLSLTYSDGGPIPPVDTPAVTTAGRVGHGTSWNPNWNEPKYRKKRKKRPEPEPEPFIGGFSLSELRAAETPKQIANAIEIVNEAIDDRAYDRVVLEMLLRRLEMRRIDDDVVTLLLLN